MRISKTDDQAKHEFSEKLLLHRNQLGLRTTTAYTLFLKHRLGFKKNEEN